ncbi:N-acetylmuramoyl-L-alanine amidase [bacterium]|nr:N-acetylmuramoyl-L-alanine amidase [bacterium]
MEGPRPGFARLRWARVMVAMLVVVTTLAPVAEAAKLRISNRYSDLNRERSRRESTEYIILHTTEGGDRSSLRRVRRAGLAHYIVMRDGRVHRVIKRHLIARHAGRSMWDGAKDLDDHALGIEVVGYHNKPITDAQYTALAELVRQLQSLYEIPDENVLTHSMVAYGRPNRWHRHEHRGRKRCGMQFARPDVRARLGLESRPLADPDVAARRLVVADPFLETVLYAPAAEADAVAEAEFEGPDTDVITATRTAWFIARDRFNDPTTAYVFPSGRKRFGHEIRDWSRIPPGTRVLLDQEPETDGAAWLTLARGQAASVLAGEDYDADTTVYVRPDGRVLRGDIMSYRDFRRLPPGTKVFVGFEYAGKVTRRHTAYDLCGPRSREESTLYLLPGGHVRTGREIREDRIPGGTHILVGS